ncbi:hypothetical protein OG308_15775 [Nocardia salmonicida]|uniref:Uncharacterized protein n=1 Tax=Nocardia salmonicida TaxID=53431 RepID=A0ABZ1NHI8_9NOCA
MHDAARLVPGQNLVDSFVNGEGLPARAGREVCPPHEVIRPVEADHAFQVELIEGCKINAPNLSLNYCGRVERDQVADDSRVAEGLEQASAIYRVEPDHRVPVADIVEIGGVDRIGAEMFWQLIRNILHASTDS